jgi:hypothetical protein
MTRLGVDAELLEFCTPWLEREPRLLLACQFAAAGACRQQFLASSVLMRELAEAALAVSDRRVAEAKLGWWAEEAAAWSAGRPRHPLARGFDPEGSARALAAMALAGREWLDAPPLEDVESLLQRLKQFARVGIDLAGSGEVDAWTSLWLALVLRLSLEARAPLASVLPLDLLARHGLRRSQWSELDAARRLPVVVDLARRLPQAGALPDDPGMAAMLILERRWLQRVSHSAADRIGFLDTIAAWRAARAAIRSSQCGVSQIT